MENCLPIIGSLMDFASKSNLSILSFSMLDFVLRKKPYIACINLWSRIKMSVEFVDIWEFESREFRKSSK